MAPLIRDAIHLKELDPPRPFPVGASRIGGEPDLPPGMRWPEGPDGPLALLAQIRLSDVAALDGENLLPHEGTLYFFYDAIAQPWDSSERGRWRVLHDPGDPARLRRTPAPRALKDEARFPPRALRPEITPTLPQSDSPAVAALALTDAEADLLLDLPFRFRPKQPLHQLLGHAFPIQGDMEEHLPAPASGPWRLLFQIDSSDAAHMMWGDVGMVYFWIPLESLRARRFEDVRIFLQCG
jgi:hypothetical protein